MEENMLKGKEKVEQKLVALQKVPQNSEDDGSAKQALGAVKLENSRKRKRIEKKSGHSEPRGCGNDASEAGWKCQKIFKDLNRPQLPDVGGASLVLDGLAAAPNVIDPCQEMDIDVENVSGDDFSGGWDSDSEDEMGEDWWTQEWILLSPSLPKVEPPFLPLEGLDSNASSPWPAASDMNLDDFSLFLDVLPPIDQEVCNEERAVANFPDIASSKSESLELHIELRGKALEGQRSKELQRRLATEQASRNAGRVS